MKTIILRFKADLPSFFVKMRALGASIGVVGAGLKALNAPQWIHQTGMNMIWIGATMALVSQLTCKDPSQLKN